MKLLKIIAPLTLLTLCAGGSTASFGAENDTHRFNEEYKSSLPSAQVTLRIAGTEEIVLAADASHCAESDADGSRLDVPDAPVRAIRTNKGLLVTAAHYNNLAYTSQDLTTFKRENCKSMLPSRLDPNPSDFSDHEWLISLYSRGGKIFGLVHDEYWGALYNLRCKLRLGNQLPWGDVCLYVNQTGAVSSDDGISFKRNGLVTAYPYVFSSEMNRNGLRDPSNLFYNPNDGYVYFMSWVDPYKEQTGGECLYRTKDPFAGRAWYAWDGKGFNVSMNSAYTNTSRHVKTCTPVSGLWITTVVYNEKHKTFVALVNDERIRPGGIFYRTSPDLINWSRPEFLLEVHNQRFWKDDGHAGPVVYPSLIDPKSDSPNFDTVKDAPYLYFIRLRVNKGQPQSRERDIVRIPLLLN